MQGAKMLKIVRIGANGLRRLHSTVRTYFIKDIFEKKQLFSEIISENCDIYNTHDIYKCPRREKY